MIASMADTIHALPSYDSLGDCPYHPAKGRLAAVGLDAFKGPTLFVTLGRLWREELASTLWPPRA